MPHSEDLPERTDGNLVSQPRTFHAYPARTMQWDFIDDARASDWVEYWNVLRRRKKAVLLLAVLGALGGLVISLPQTPIYQARTAIEILGLNENVLNLRGGDTNATARDYTNRSYIETQMEILQSEGMLERVVKKLNLDAREDFAGDPGRLASWLRAAGLVRRQAIPREQAIDMAARSVQVRSSGQTRIVRIFCDSPDPKLAADFANTLADEFIERSLEVRWTASQGTSEWLTRQLQDLKLKLQKSEDELQAYARANDLMFTGEKGTVAEENLRQLQAELSRAQSDRVARQSQYEIANSSPPDTLPEVLDSGPLRDYTVKLADLRRQLAELEAAYTPGHYRVQRMQAQIRELETTLQKERGNVIKRIRNEYEAALRREKLLAASYERQAKVVSDEAAKSIQYSILKREVDSHRMLYEAMLQKVKEADIASAMKASNIAIVDRAKPPSRPYKPNHPANTGLGLLVGILGGVVFAFVREQVDRSLRDRGDAPQYLQLPELGVIPSTRLDPVKRAPSKRQVVLSLRKVPSGPALAAGNGEPGGLQDGERVELVTWQRKPSMLAESFRATLTSILSAGQNGDRPRVFVFSSPGPMEGKTTVVSNLGIALAEINRRVLLIDADLRRPQLHKVFDVSNSWGLSDLLREKNPVEGYPREALARPTQIPDLHVLPSGPGTVSISNLLYSARLPQLLQRLRQEYDTILIDTPPMLQISDARVLAQLADAAILVLRAGQTTRDAALAAKQRFAEDGTPLLGTILNDWTPGASKDYDSYYYYYDSKPAS